MTITCRGDSQKGLRVAIRSCLHCCATSCAPFASKVLCQNGRESLDATHDGPMDHDGPFEVLARCFCANSARLVRAVLQLETLW